MLNAQSAKVYFLEFAINTCKLKNSWWQLFWETKIVSNYSNLVVKSKVPPHSASVALRQLNPFHKKGPQSLFFKKKSTHEIKPTQKNESEE